jgi:hypothetical protein
MRLHHPYSRVSPAGRCAYARRCTLRQFAGGISWALSSKPFSSSRTTISRERRSCAAITGASEQNIKKGDQVTLEYQLMKTGLAEPFATKSASAKAGENGEDLLSPLIEQTATEVLGAVRSLTAAE